MIGSPQPGDAQNPNLRGAAADLSARSQQHPLIFAVENLHWIDPTSEAFFAPLMEYRRLRLFVLVSYRPGYRPPWTIILRDPDGAFCPSHREDSLQMLRAVFQASSRLGHPWSQKILAKAQGNPFFLEEIAQTLVEQGGLRPEGGMGLSPAMQLPATVQAVLAARIDRLPADEKASATDVGGDW